jgi:hypothetical protein
MQIRPIILLWAIIYNFFTTWREKKEGNFETKSQLIGYHIQNHCSNMSFLSRYRKKNLFYIATITKMTEQNAELNFYSTS